jgi:sulfur dioxygenase
MLFHELNHLNCKTYVLGCEESRKVAIVDPLRDKVERYLSFLAYHGYRLDLIIDTHTHADHLTGAFELGDLSGAPVAMHRRAPAPHVSVHFEDGQIVNVGSIALKVLHTPGHTPDSISLCADGRVLTGDTLFIHGTGRADFAGGDPGAQYDAITGKLFALPDDTLVFPAHDYRGHTQSTIGEEKRSNPRLAGRSREAYVEIMNNLGLPLPDKIQEALQSNQTAIQDESVKFPKLAMLSTIRQLTAAQLMARIGAGDPPLLLDVREEDEFRGELGHVAGARLLPLREISERAAEIEPFKHRDMVTICRAGVRSATAAAILTGLGFERVWNLTGGMLDWNDARLPVER